MVQVHRFFIGLYIQGSQTESIYTNFRHTNLICINIKYLELRHPLNYLYIIDKNSRKTQHLGLRIRKKNDAFIKDSLENI